MNESPNEQKSQLRRELEVFGSPLELAAYDMMSHKPSPLEQYELLRRSVMAICFVLSFMAAAPEPQVFKKAAMVVLGIGFGAAVVRELLHPRTLGRNLIVLAVASALFVLVYGSGSQDSTWLVDRGPLLAGSLGLLLAGFILSVYAAREAVIRHHNNRG